MDVWIAVNPKNAKRVVAVLHEFGFGSKELTEGLFLQQDKIIRMGNPPIRIEISTGISGVDFESCFAERISDTIDGVQVPIISLQKLKANKKAAGRLKDLDDLENL